MLTIIFGPPGSGKTSLMAYFLNESAFDFGRIRFAKKEYEQLCNELGTELNLPKHFTFFNGRMNFRKPGFTKRENLMLYPDKLGIQNKAPEGIECQFIPTGSTLGVTEAQGSLRSRGGDSIPAYQFSFYEENRHNDLTIYLDTQRPMMIDKQVRDISQGISIVDRKNIYDKYGTLKRIVWIIDLIKESCIDFYINAKNKRERREYAKREHIVCPYNIYKIYDSKGCKDDFRKGYSIKQISDIKTYSEV